MVEVACGASRAFGETVELAASAVLVVWKIFDVETSAVGHGASASYEGEAGLFADGGVLVD